MADAEAPAPAPAPEPAPAKPAAKAPAKAKPSYSTDPALYMYTSLTAGSSHIVTATSRLETILKANRVPFKALDLATDDKARMLWGRRAGKDESGRMRKLPGLVQMGLVLGDLVEIEDWNEYGELKQHVKIYYDEFTIPPKGAKQIPNPLKKPVYGKTPVGVPTAISSSTTPKPGGVPTAISSSTTPKPVPAAPPLPEKKEATPAKKADNTKKPAAAAAAPPSKSIAEEAAQKAKQVRLDSLRATVAKDKAAALAKEKAAAATAATTAASASKDGGDDEKKETAKAPETIASAAVASTQSSTDESDSSESEEEDTKGLTITPSNNKASDLAGLQSPTSGAWKSSTQEDNLRNVLQSPTSGTWKSGQGGLTLPIREDNGPAIVDTPKEATSSIKKADATPKAAVEAENDDEDESDDDSGPDEEDTEAKKL